MGDEREGGDSRNRGGRGRIGGQREVGNEGTERAQRERQEECE